MVGPLVEVAATHVVKLVTWPAIALLPTWEVRHRRALVLVAVEATEASDVGAMVSPTTGQLHATNAVDLTTMLEIVKLKL